MAKSEFSLVEKVLIESHPGLIKQGGYPSREGLVMMFEEQGFPDPRDLADRAIKEAEGLVFLEVHPEPPRRWRTLSRLWKRF